MRFAINGFGRIGRCVARIWAQDSQLQQKIQLVQINSPSGGEIGGHLLKYDSVHGTFAGSVAWHDPQLEMNDQSILFTKHRDLASIQWQGVDVVLECSGRYKTPADLAKHIHHDVKHVLLSSPGKDIDQTIVYGVNHRQLKAEHQLVSAASCTTNALAPILAILENSVGIEAGFMTTVHAYTTDQNLTDASHQDLRRARAAGQSMIPTKTGAASSIGEVLPSLAGKLDGVAIRVPTANVSLLDITLNLSQSTSVKAINDLLIDAAHTTLKGVLGTSDLPLVSCDFNGRFESAVLDLTQTKVNGSQVKLMAWYDNEWAFAHRMINLIQHFHALHQVNHAAMEHQVA